MHQTLHTVLLRPLPLRIRPAQREVTIQLRYLTPGFCWQIEAQVEGQVGYWQIGGRWGIEEAAKRALWVDGWHVVPGTPVARLLWHLHDLGLARCRITDQTV